MCSSLRCRLFLLVVLVCAPLAGEILHSAWRERRSQVADWAQRSQQISQLAAREESSLIEQTRQLLLTMAESSQVRTGDRRECKEFVDSLTRGYPQYTSLQVINANGELLAGAPSPDAPPPQTEPQRGAERLIAKTATPTVTNASRFDAELFARVLQTRAFAIGDIAGNPDESQRIIDFGVPVLASSGGVVAVVVAALDWARANNLESELRVQLPDGATWIEVSRRGTILACYPPTAAPASRPFPDRTLLETVFNEQPGVMELRDAGGGLNVYAFSKRHSQLIGGEVCGILAVSKGILFAGVNRKLVRSLSSLGVAAGLALFLGWLGSSVLVLRRIKALVKSSGRLADGDLSARTGLPHGKDELGQLTRAFDQMAQVLEQHETERERAKHRLQVLSHRLVEAQESERRQIARELHDQIGQALTVAQMNLQAVSQSANGSDRSSRLKECIDVVENVLEQVHDLSLNLRPSMLDDLGLVPALRWLTEKQASLADLRFEVRSNLEDLHLTPAVKTECFRVAQEALTNIVRHAHARSVMVELQHLDGLLELRVRDDGAGFDVNAVRERAVRGASLGLLSMEERAALVGGVLEVKSAAGQGTEVHAWFPTRLPIPEAFIETERNHEDDSHHYS